MVRRGNLMTRTAELRLLLRRLFVAALFLAAFVFAVAEKFDSVAVEAANKAVLEVTGPVMQVVEYPARMVHRFYTFVYDISHIYSENRQLRSENRQLMMLQNKVRALEAENQLLGRLLNYAPPPEAKFISAKIIAESGDNFTHILLVYTGGKKVKKGQVVLGEESVIGRVDDAGKNYARIILVTDINSKIPVTVERTRARAILSGDNTMNPKLVFLRSDADVREGDVIITSGVGGMFPAGLPVGFVSSADGGIITVEPVADLSRIEYVRIVDYGLSTGTDAAVLPGAERDAQ